MNWIQRLVSKAFRLGPAVVEPADVAFGADPAEWAPTRYGEYLAQSSSVYACASLRARSIAGLPIYAYQDGEELKEGPIHDLLKKVNPHWTWSRLLHMTELSLCLWGQCFWVIERGDDGLGVPSEIWWARPDNMRIVPDPTNYIQGYIYEWNNQRIAFRQSEVIWFRYPNPLDEFAGLSPIAATRLAVDTGHAALRSNYSIFANGVQLAGIVTPDDKDATWASEQVTALRDMLDKRFRGADKAHRLAVLGQSAKFTPMSVTPKDAQFIELMQWTRSDVAMVYGIPPELIGDNSHATYNNIREAHKGVWNDTLIPEAEMIISELREQLIPMFGVDGLDLQWDYHAVNALAADLGEIAKQASIWSQIGVPLNAVLAELAPQFLNYSPDGAGYSWGDTPLMPMAIQEPMQEALPAERSLKFAEYPGLRFIAPQAVRDAARKGLELYEEGRGGDGLQPRTIREARSMAAREDVTPDKIRRMVAWFARHDSDRRPGWDEPGKETPGYVAWLLWGGDPGRAWAIKMVKDMDAIDAERDKTLKQVGDVIEIGSIEHERRYKQFERQVDRIEVRMRRKVRELFQRQQAKLINDLRVENAKAINEPEDIEPIWDAVAYNEEFADELAPLIGQAVEAGGQNIIDEYNLRGSWNVRNEAAQAFIRNRAQRFAEQVNDTTWNRLRSSLEAGIGEGEDIDQLAERIQVVMEDRIASSAEVIARTETIGALNGGSLLAAESTGEVQAKQWLATFDGRERETHAEAHIEYQANPIPLDEPFIVGGVALNAPGDAVFGGRESAGEVIQCRCTMTFVLRGENEPRSSAVSHIKRWVEGH